MSGSYHDQDDVIGFCPDMRHPWGCQDDSGHTPQRSGRVSSLNDPQPGGVMSDEMCPHCSHLWDNHDGLLSGSPACDVCGCLWQPPKPPEPPPPPTARELLIGNAEKRDRRRARRDSAA